MLLGKILPPNGRSLGPGLLTVLTLVLGLGLLPEQCAGLKCDQGEGNVLPGKTLDDLKRESVTIKEDCAEDQFCYNHTLDETVTVSHLDWGCTSKEINKCFQDIKGYGGRDCHVVNYPRSSDTLEQKKGRCIDRFTNTRPTARIQKRRTKVKREILCLCQTDLCNRGSGWVPPEEIVETTTVEAVTEGGKTGTTGPPGKKRRPVPKEAEFVMYFGIVLVSSFAVASCYLLLCLDRKWRCKRRK